MSNYINYETLKFILHDVHDLARLFKHERFQDVDTGAVNLLLDAVKDYSDKKLYPVFREMDEKPAYFKDGKIHVHPIVGEVMKSFGDLGLIGGHFDYDDGGMQLPETVLNAAMYIIGAANNHLTGYPGLTGGSAHLISTFANQELKDIYLEKMTSGQWAGTMCLTEPQAGSSLSDLTTTASLQEDSSYSIKGQKIFISGGDHEMSENFVHLVLARIDGAPAGTKGISLFVVPKYLPEGEKLTDNYVRTAADFQKLGQRGYCTAHLTFGEDGTSQGWLVGQEHHGLKYMFQMMNGARIAVGRDGASVASAAYHTSLQYANERIQGRKIKSSGKKNVNENPVAIIQHADVRRMLLLQKAIYEGSLALVLETSMLFDEQHVMEGDAKAKTSMLLEMLTPLCKTYPSEKGKESVDNGLQILGGYGFCLDFVLQQYLRDIRIMSIYEGTTGIQSLDLLGRKIPMQGGAALGVLVQEMTNSITESHKHENLKEYGNQLAEKMKTIQSVLENISSFAAEGDFEKYLADATPFMEMFSTLVVAWQWLKMALVAQQALDENETKYGKAFYESKIHTMKYFYQYELSRITGIAEIFTHSEFLTLASEGEEIIQ